MAGATRVFTPPRRPEEPSVALA